MARGWHWGSCDVWQNYICSQPNRGEQVDPMQFLVLGECRDVRSTSRKSRFARQRPLLLAARRMCEDCVEYAAEICCRNAEVMQQMLSIIRTSASHSFGWQGFGEYSMASDSVANIDAKEPFQMTAESATTLLCGRGR